MCVCVCGFCMGYIPPLPPPVGRDIFGKGGKKKGREGGEERASVKGLERGGKVFGVGEDNGGGGVGNNKW